MSKKKSRFSTRGGSGLGWDNIDLLGRRERQKGEPDRAKRVERERLALSRNKQRKRITQEAGTNWTLVRLLLDGNKGLSLTDAKRMAGTIEGYAKN